MSEAERASDFLQAQQHYYRELRTHKNDLAKFQASREEHRAALVLLADLPKQVLCPQEQQAHDDLASHDGSILCTVCPCRRGIASWYR